MKRLFEIFIGIFLAILVSGNALGQTWYKTTTIVSGQEYLIGFVVGDDIYLAVNYAIGESNNYYTSYNVNWYGYTAKAIFDEENIIGVEGYANDLEYCKFIFYENSENNYTIKSSYEDYYLSTWSSTDYADLHPKSYDTYGKDWKFKNNKLYRKVNDDNRYARYFNLNGTPHMCVTSNENEASQIELYSKDNPMPIELTSFQAECTGNSSNITWTTATETNNEYFILEHSTDAINFYEITRVPGVGTSIEPNNYEYIDYNATDGDNYYRLIQVDYDGTGEVSEIIVAKCNELKEYKIDKIEIYPNPTKDEVTIINAEGANILIINQLGQIVLSLENAANNQTINITNFTNGTYFVKIGSTVEKLVISK